MQQVEENSTVSPIWLKISKELKEKIPSQFYEGFFTNITPLTWDGKELVLGSNDKRIIQHVEKNYTKLLESSLQTCTGTKGKINFQELSRMETTPTDNMQKNFNKTTENFSAYSTSNNIPSTVTNEEKGKQMGTVQINPSYTFNRFIKGPSNEHALAAAMGVAENPTKYHNPLYLYGGVGLGKTHLMMAIGNEIARKYPWLKVSYFPAEIFQNTLVEAVQNKTLPYVRARYRDVDILLIDDIQFISQRAEFTQEEIFHLFNYLYQNNKHIVISGDRPPQQLSTLTDRLVSRFQSGLIVDIKPPNLETRMAILSTKAKEANLQLPHDVLRFIAGRISDQVRVLESALIKLEFVSKLEKRPVDLQMAKIALRDLPSKEVSNQISIEEIVRVVSQNFHVDEDEIKGNSRVENVALARHICMYVVKQLIPALSLSKIAAAFGKNDHTTVINADKKIREKMDQDEAFAVQIREIMESLRY